MKIRALLESRGSEVARVATAASPDSASDCVRCLGADSKLVVPLGEVNTNETKDSHLRYSRYLRPGVGHYRIIPDYLWSGG